ncbi:hypothetical protein RN001_009373 [Aquatica leii]|uniref:Uncharacterized protein n=1 Tax=Aquatica leii TaxID=1421715 RepID=A0AAN7P562_9COLE|nr:hypothetical protein RN001_009373 [Aquatica leii]
METEELIKLVDGIYKNILDKFNPGARQMINAGKAYLKALHGAAAASRLYVDAISKLARQAQQGTWGGCSDIGAALMKVVEVYKEIQDQQMNILKAFYVDLLVPLETNLEKDTKVVQSEQKRFLQQHKQRSETYSKAAATMKKQRKKSKGASKGGLAMDKELKNMQVLEEEKTKLDSFCEQSLKNAMTQERRRYGFVLERHCSLTKHYMSYHAQGVNAYQQNLEKWQDVAKTREFLPESVENIFSTKIRNVSIWQDDDLYSNPRSPHYDDDRMSISSQLRKTKSMDASCLDIRSIEDVGSPVTTLSRAKSDFNLNSSIPSLAQDYYILDTTPTRCRPKSMAVPPVPPPQWETQLAKALYAYLSSGDNQLSFLEGDVIALIGERNKGWQFGENLRTQCTGWFPLAYTELMDDSTFSPKHRSDISESHTQGTLRSTPSTGTITPLSPSGPQPSNTANLENPAPRMFGDTLHLHRSSANAKQIRRAIASNNIPPPALPAPVPTPSLPYHKTGITQSQSTNFSSKPEMDMSTFQTPYSQTSGLKMSTSSFNFTSPSSGSYSTHPQMTREKPTGVNALPIHLQTKGGKIGGPVGNVSLHSSNDSGFSNDPPPQPEVDYSDDDSIPGQTKVPVRRRRPSLHDNNNNTKKLPATQPPLDDTRNYLSDDQSINWRTDEKKGFVKRTKSFWKFGKSGSDNEVLEGMALWKHRDLVDIDEKKKKRATIDRRTIQKREKLENANKPNIKRYDNKVRQQNRKEFIENQKLSLPRQESQINVNENFENQFDKRKIDNNQFYDHEDGLILRTVNRKNILQQYNDDTGSDTDSETEVTSDDPYDCIVVDDQTQKIKRNGESFPNVAAIGKKLEKLSKSSKYSPDKQKNVNGNAIKSATMERSDTIKSRNEKNKIDNRSNTLEHSDIIKYRKERRSFKTFGVETQNDENGEKELNENDRFYKQRNNENNSRYYIKNNELDNVEQERRLRSSYESINSDTDQHEIRNNVSGAKRVNADSENREKLKYYNERNRDTSADEFSDAVESRQFLPRTKLTKTNSNGSNLNAELGLMNYGESLKRRLKGTEHGSKYNEKSPRSGNTYGPWYPIQLRRKSGQVLLHSTGAQAEKSGSHLLECFAGGAWTVRYSP